MSNPSSVFLPDELVTEVVSFCDVKSLLRMRCVCKSWKSIISDPKFVKLHLNRSARNPHLTLYLSKLHAYGGDYNVVPFPVRRFLVENSVISLPNDTHYRLRDNDGHYIVGSCNGLLCLLGYSLLRGKTWFRLWNPAMRKMSPKLGYFGDGHQVRFKFKFAFGYGNSTDTYKCVRLLLDEAKMRTRARVFSLHDNVWKPVQDFPAVLLPFDGSNSSVSDGVHLNGRIIWLAHLSEFGYVSMYEFNRVKVKKFVIVSLDLGTETYTQLMPPTCDFDEKSIFKTTK